MANENPKVDPQSMLEFTRRIKQTHPGCFPEFHRLNRAKHVLVEAEKALAAARLEASEAQKAWDAVGAVMARELIRARPGVYGRQATPEEAKRLRAFAEQYVADAPKRAAEDAAALRRAMQKLRKMGYGNS